MAESNTYTGVVSGLLDRDSSYQILTSKEAIEANIRWAAFNKTNFTKVLGLEGFGVDAMKNLQVFGAAKPSGMVRYKTGSYAFSGNLFATTGTSHHSGRMGSHTPSLIEGGHEYKFAWHYLHAERFCPEMDKDDNAGGYIDILTHKLQEVKQVIVRDFNYCVLGNASAPDSGSLGPGAVDSDLPNLISVTQTSAVAPGGLSAANSYWQNKYKACTSLGGGGEMDRPLVLRRALGDVLNDTLVVAEATSEQDYLILTTQGGFQYYDRLQYADGVQTGKGDFGLSSKYDAAGVIAQAFRGIPIVWDPAVTVPTGATAATECFYGIHKPNFGVSIRTEKNFKVTGWEGPRAHDQYRTHVVLVEVRYTPFITARRPHFVLYNIPACPD